MKELELPWLKKVSWASHFGKIFMESSVMADIPEMKQLLLYFLL